MRRSFFILCTVFLFTTSCSQKSQDRIPQDKFPQEITAAFTTAGLPLLSQKIAPRSFNLPIASSSIPETLSKRISPEELKGKVVFLNFWATWCGPCRAEMPSMESLYARYRDRGFEILAINSGERAADVITFMNEYGLTFPALLDLDGTVNRSYGIQAIPTSYLIDREGMIIMRLVGSIDWNTSKIHEALELLLN